MSDAVSQEVNKEQKGLKNSLFDIKTVPFYWPYIMQIYLTLAIQ